MSRIELNIIALSNSESSKGNFALILEEKNGIRRLPIIIGGFEAQAIAIALEKMQTNRPLTHDLFKNTLDQSGVSIQEIEISRLENGVFYAQLNCENNLGQIFQIDARSSDAIALAIRFDCPIFTYEEVMEQASVVLDNPSQTFTQKRGGFTDYSLSELQDMLAKVLAKEDYESASKIRDAIRQKTE